MLITVKLDWVCLVESILTDDEIIWTSLNLFDANLTKIGPHALVKESLQMLEQIEVIQESTLFLELRTAHRVERMLKQLRSFGIVLTWSELIERSLIYYMKDKSWKID